MQVAILGPLVVEDGGQPIEVGGARLRALLIRLAAHPGGWVSVNALAIALWDEDRPGDQVNALQSLVSRLRRAIPRPALIESGPAGYRLVVDPEAVDAVRFERLAVRGRQQLAAGHPSTAAELLADALELWRGPALTEVADAPYAAAWAHRLDELRLTATDDRLDAELQLGNHPDLIAELEELVAAHPLRERTRSLLIRALYGSGRQADALAAYDQLRRTLADELGLDPSAELRELQVAVLRDDPALRPSNGRRPEAAPPPGRRTNLRSPLTSFVGRQDDLRQLRQLLERSRLVTLVGTGGAGKTRLASEAAGSLTSTGTDGVWLVELAPVTDPNDLPSTTLSSIGNRDTALLDRTSPTHRDALSRLVETLGEHDVVLLLDNCEHLVDAAAKLAEYLLGQCPRLTVLATSREPLGIVGESLWPVRPLPAPLGTDDVNADLATPAVTLFADRAALVRPGFTVNADNAGPVTEICRRLDGLPLAIELAAARLRNLPVEAVAARLGDRFRLLTGGSRTAMPRHQTLRAVVAWSWDLLTESERRLAERLAVFQGGATAQTAEAICAQGSGPELEDAISADAVLDLLAALADKSLLVIVDGTADVRPAQIDGTEPRYRMLETIREFATEQLAERGEIVALRQAHARYFLDLAETAEPHLRGPDQLIWLARLAVERDNLLAALRFAAETSDADAAIRLGAALSWYWTLLGRHDEAAVWLDQALKVPGERPRSEYLRARVVHTISAAAAGWGSPSTEQTDEMLRLVKDLDLQREHPLLSLVEPGLAMFHDDGGLAQAALLRNLSHPDPWARSTMQLMRGLMGENDGDWELMERTVPLAIEGFREIGDRWGIGTSVAVMANVYSARGDLEGAIAALEEVRQLMTELRAADDEAYSVMRIGLMRLRMGDFGQARRDLETAARLSEHTGSAMMVAFARFGMATLAHYEGRTDEARRLAEEALADIRRSSHGPPQIKAAILSGLAIYDVQAGELDDARARLGEAFEAVQATRDMPVGAQVATAAADLMLARGEPALSAELLGASVRLRGAEDVTDPEVQRIATAAKGALGAEEYARHHSHGRALSRAEALALLQTTIAEPPL